MSPNPKVLHVIPSVSTVHGGPSRAIAAMEKALCLAGASVTTLTTDDDGPGRRLLDSERPTRINGATRIYVRKWTDFYKIALGGVPWLWNNINRFDVVHIHALFSFTSIAAGAIASLRNVPYILRPLGTLSTYGVENRRPWLKQVSLTFIEKPLLRNAASVHLTSQAELNEAIALGVHFRGAIVPLGVETPVRANQQSKPCNLRGGQRVLFLSRIDRKKNIEGLLHAFAIIRNENREALLSIAGEGREDYVAELQALTTELSLEDRVEWLGHVDGPRKSNLFAKADVFVLPSFSENFGIAAAEAMLAGLPCVLAEGVGIAKEVSEAGAGLITAADPTSVAKALGRLLEDANFRHDVGRRATVFARREYSTSKMAERLLALYEDAISVRRD
jgi:glycosyltransferase involved in cell wall biosynthesis